MVIYTYGNVKLYTKITILQAPITGNYQHMANLILSPTLHWISLKQIPIISPVSVCAYIYIQKILKKLSPLSHLKVNISLILYNNQPISKFPDCLLSVF